MSAARRFSVREVPPSAHEALLRSGLSPLMARLLAARGLQAAQDLDPSPRGLLPPDTLESNMQAASLLADAIATEQRLLIVGDYDCDGATGVATGVLGLRMLGATVDYLVPNRFEHGYGLTPDIVELALAHPRLGRPDLLITVDNGVASIDGVAHARRHGLRVIVTDHHLPGNTLPEADLIINPNLRGSRFGSRHLAGVGVMFYLLMALRAELRRRGAFASRPEPALAELLDLVALGTVADVVRLDRNNRILVQGGLARIRQGRARPGILALLAVAGREARAASARDLGFTLGPRINAAGRLSDISLGVDCLLATDPAQAHALAQRLDAMNRERRDIEAEMNEQALADIGEPDPRQRSIVAYSPGWHPGVVGLLASRLKERHGRPALALARDDQNPGVLRGSGRSIEGVHLRDVLDLVDRRLPGALIRFGGHAMAAGLSLHEARLPDFQEALEEAIAALCDPACFDPVLACDGGLAAAEMSITSVRDIATQVWGSGFPAPLFVDPFTVRQQRVLDSGHLKLELEGHGRRWPAIWFRRETPLPDQCTLAYELQRDDWRGGDAIQLVIQHRVEAAS
jgi:single-stranded-DNA-specific exonuclease